MNGMRGWAKIRFKYYKIIPQFYYYDRIFPYIWDIFAKDNSPDLKLFFTYILLVSLTLQSFYRSIMTMEYEIHLPDYIANCINKSRPDLHCNGQCVLMQKIRDKEKKESKKNFVVYEYSSHYVHKEFSTLIKPITVEEPVEKPLPIYISEYRFEFSNPLFRPPIA